MRDQDLDVGVRDIAFASAVDQAAAVAVAVLDRWTASCDSANVSG